MAEDPSTDSVKESFVFLDFNGKLVNPLVNEKFYLKIGNLHKKKPLVQINDLLFKGCYDFAIGTNLFFDISGSPAPKGPFRKNFDLQVTPMLCETRVINLKPVQTAAQEIVLPNCDLENIEFNFNCDYNTLIEKLANGSLKLEDMTASKLDHETSLVEPPIEELGEKIEKAQEKLGKKGSEVPKANEIPVDNGYEISSSAEELIEDYRRLKQLSMRPVKREVQQEVVAECENKYKDAFEYHNIERQILQPSDAFPKENIADFNDKNLSQFIDINRCILYGLLKPSKDVPRILSREEKKLLLSLENFDNLSLTARYGVIEKHVQNMEEYLKTASEEELCKEDEFGRSPMKTLDIYKKLKDALRKRLEEIKYSLSKSKETRQNNKDISGSSTEET